MDYDMLFSIGELAKICNVTPKTLRYYDKLGLLKPEMVNPDNGYRFYSRWHITRVTTIKQLQDAGIRLDDIHSFFEQDDSANVADSLSKLLYKQKKVISSQIAELSKQLTTVDSLQAQCQRIKEKITYDDTSGIMIRRIPGRIILYKSYQGEYTPSLFRESYQEILSLLKTKGNCLGEMKLSGPLAIYETSGDRSYHDKVRMKLGLEINVQTAKIPLPALCIDEALYACYIYKGPYSRIKSELYPVIEAKIETMGYQCLAPYIEYYHINESMAESDLNFLSEIQIPVKVRNN